MNDKIKLDEIMCGIIEPYQIGFRLEKQSEGIQLKAIDHSGPWLNDYLDFIADTLTIDYYQKIRYKEQLEFKKRQKRSATNTIKENLIYLNEGEQIINNHDCYNHVATRVKDDAKIMFSFQEPEQEIESLPYQMRSYDFNKTGLELVTEWYKRNLFICRNI